MYSKMQLVYDGLCESALVHHHFVLKRKGERISVKRMCMGTEDCLDYGHGCTRT